MWPGKERGGGRGALVVDEERSIFTSPPPPEALPPSFSVWVLSMAAAATMDIHERGRLSVSKTSSKISKPSSVLKKIPAAPSSFPPPPSAPARPVPKVVNADPSSFRRVVQELTGTTPSSTPTLPTSSSSPPQVSALIARSSRLQRIAPPPLRPDFRNLQPQHDQQHLLQQNQRQQQSFLQQQQQQQQEKASHLLLQQQQHHQHQQHMQNGTLNQHQQQQEYQFPMVGPLSPPLPFTQFGNPNPSPYFTPSLPMLSPHLLSPLPALTPGDNTWANPLDSIPVPSQPLANPTNSFPSLLQLPTMSGETLANGHGHGYLPMGITSSHGQPLPPLLTNPPPPLPFAPTSRVNWLPPWSPSPLFSPPPLSPGSFPFSPGLGPSLNITGLASPKDFTFRGPSDYIYRPS